MATATTHTRARAGIDAPPVTVEILLSGGLPGFSIVGLPETAVREARDRVRGALLASHFEFPASRIIANLAPADLPKEGGRFDLAIAIGLLVASGQVPARHLEQVELLGELGLAGHLRSVPGALPAAIAAGDANRGLVASTANAQELTFAQRAPVWTCDHLLEVCELLRAEHLPVPASAPVEPPGLLARSGTGEVSLDDVRGHLGPKRALEIAAAGGHNLLMIGPPGTGKSMLARRLITLLPPLTEQQVVEVASIYSVAGLERKRWTDPPFRDPHHSASAAAIVGGGTSPRPGEISLAHGGVLFLDEMPEFSRQVLETLREPLEAGEILIARARQRVRFPARFQLIGAMNPCPAGRVCTPADCRCTRDARTRYQSRISAPLMDRMDLFVSVDQVDPAMVRDYPAPADTGSEDDSPASTTKVGGTTAAKRAHDARRLQLQRHGCINRDLPPRQIEQSVGADEGALALLDDACERLGLSMRGYHRSLRVARTIADLDGDAAVTAAHIAEALSYRPESALTAGGP